MKKFDPRKLHKLNNPERLSDIPPEYIWDKINIRNPEVLVDIGAGTGFFSIAFLDYIKSGKIFACDTSDVMIQWMKENICPEHPGIVPLKMQENAIPLEDRMADLVYMINLHHELDDPDALLEESFRILKNRGVIVIIDWKKEDMPTGPPLHIRYSPEQVTSQLHSADFHNVKVFDEMAKHFLVIAEKNL